MAQVRVREVGGARPSPFPAGCRGEGKALAYFDEAANSIHLHQIDIAPGGSLRLEPTSEDRLIYVWRGRATAGGVDLPDGSSAIVERGSALEVQTAEAARLLLFSAPPASGDAQGGGVRLLPAALAPRSPSLGGSPGLGGVMHANSESPTCAFWLHENSFPGRQASRDDAEAGIHSHSEDEIIFVLDGAIRLGNRICGPGTALAIAAETLYSFTAGPDGLRFLNFRAAMPTDIRFASGASISEPDYWRDRLPAPSYLTLLG